jgi:hypothetical protein
LKTNYQGLKMRQMYQNIQRKIKEKNKEVQMENVRPLVCH